MSTLVLDRIEGWDTRPFTGGYRALQTLADREFSGVVRADSLELFVTRGTAVSVRGGDIEAFEDVSGTAYEAPSPALPLLAVMQEQDNEVRDSFYTEQTPISTVDETLSAGGFTGYIELSENVLSGDYYLVYHAGESMSVAFVGQSARFVHGNEALESTNNEVGIYQVRPADIHPLDLPEPEPTDDDRGGPADAGPPREGEQTEPERDPGREESAESAEHRPPTGEPEPSKPAEGSAKPVPSAETGAGSIETRTEPAPSESEPGGDGSGQQSVDPDEGSTSAETGTHDPGEDTDSERRVIPSVDPALTAGNEVDDTVADQPTDTPALTERSPPDDTIEASGAESDEPTPALDGPTPEHGDDEGVTTDSETVERFEQRLDSLEDECEALRERLDEVETARDELRDELAAIREQRSER